MENLGKYLLELRLQRGYSYQDIWNELRFKEDQIKAIEENRLSALGPYGIAKAVVFNYARYLEADLNSVMNAFSIMMPESNKPEFKPATTVKEKKIMLSTNFMWTLGILVIIIILGSILWYSYNQNWLRPPNFFTAKKSDSTAVSIKEQKEETKPDTLRQHLQAISEAIPKTNNIKIDNLDSKTVPPDTTDYLGNILGDSPINVPIH
ncbi:MAG TPA: helix-turn-helix domain-containing protein [Candidatus Cloacimonas sp.]|nr:helix-turn-helix domain-containing protein [Candidatus Cloacimonas sp.]